MDLLDTTTPFADSQGQTATLSHVFTLVDSSSIVRILQTYRWTGRQGYSIPALWRAYLASFVLNLPHTNALIREFQDNSDLRHICGFADQLPHRTTFNRFISRLSHYQNLVQNCLTQTTNYLKTIIPDLGDQVAIDSTAVRSHSNGNRKKGASDPEATWGVKHSAGTGNNKQREFFYGYKSHAIADANYGIPLAHLVTTGSQGDTTMLPSVLNHAVSILPWLKPAFVIADRGYDSAANHKFIDNTSAIPIIHIRRPDSRQKVNGVALHDGIYTAQGVPTSIGMVPMDYVETDERGWRRYRCPNKGCHLKNSTAGGIRHCDTDYYQDPRENIRLFGVIRRDSQEWRDLYTKRQAIERVFKSMKESRRLERHCVRGLRQISLHILMSTLAFQVTTLLNLLEGRTETSNWMVRKIA